MTYKGRTLWLIATAAVALTALTGTASATRFTSPAGTVYTSTIKAESEGVVKIICEFGSCASISCDLSNLEAKVEQHGATSTVAGKISSFTLSGCTSGGTATSPVAKPGTFETHSSGSSNGNFAIGGMTITVHSTAVGTCNFEVNSELGALTGSSTTGGKATIDVHGLIDVEGSNPFCGSVAILDGSYRITTPSTLYVD